MVLYRGRQDVFVPMYTYLHYTTLTFLPKTSLTQIGQELQSSESWYRHDPRSCGAALVVIHPRQVKSSNQVKG